MLFVGVKPVGSPDILFLLRQPYEIGLSAGFIHTDFRQP